MTAKGMKTVLYDFCLMLSMFNFTYIERQKCNIGLCLNSELNTNAAMYQPTTD